MGLRMIAVGLHTLAVCLRMLAVGLCTVAVGLRMLAVGLCMLAVGLHTIAAGFTHDCCGSMHDCWFVGWNYDGFHFTLIYFRLATIYFNHCN